MGVFDYTCSNCGLGGGQEEVQYSGILRVITKQAKTVYLDGGYTGYGSFFVSDQKGKDLMFAPREFMDVARDAKYQAEDVVCERCTDRPDLYGYAATKLSKVGVDVQVSDFLAIGESAPAVGIADDWPGTAAPRDKKGNILLKGHVVYFDFEDCVAAMGVDVPTFVSWVHAAGGQTIQHEEGGAPNPEHVTDFLSDRLEEHDYDVTERRIVQLCPQRFKERYGSPHVVSGAGGSAGRGAGSSAGGGTASGGGRALGKAKKGSLAGLTIVVTGSIPGHSRESFSRLISQHGGTSGQGISSGTTHLLVGVAPGAGKVSEAQKRIDKGQDITVTSLQDFSRAYPALGLQAVEEEGAGKGGPPAGTGKAPKAQAGHRLASSSSASSAGGTSLGRSVHLQCCEGSSNKFYAMRIVDGTNVLCEWGALMGAGKAVSQQTKAFATAQEAEKFFDKTEAQKRKGGYT